MRKPALLVLCVMSCCLSCRQRHLPADADHEFDNGSKIATIATDSVKIKELANLGRLWGFIKYYHADVAKGGFNMDAALLRVLPQVLAAPTVTDANAVMERWVDGFGIPVACKNCFIPAKSDSSKLLPDFGNLFDTGNLPPTLVQ